MYSTWKRLWYTHAPWVHSRSSPWVFTAPAFHPGHHQRNSPAEAPSPPFLWHQWVPQSMERVHTETGSRLTGEMSSDPTGDWPRLPVSVQESLVEAWVSSGLRQGRGHWVRHCVHGTFRRSLPLSSLPPPEFGLRSNHKEGTEPHPSTENWIKRFTEYGSAHQNKTQFPPQSVSPIRKLPQASYPYPSKGWQNEKHNHRKQTDHMDHSLV